MSCSNDMPKDKPTITGEWRVPLYILGSAIGLAVLMTSQWSDLRAEVQANTRDAVTQDQFREFIDTARDLNPAIHWPRLPERKKASRSPDPVAVFGRREIELKSE